MDRPVSSAFVGIFLGLSVPLASASAQDPFWLHPYNFFGEETALTASVNLGDLDGDGDLDGFAVNGRHWIQQDEVFLNNGLGFFRSARNAGPDRATGYEAALADLDGDGDLDAAIARDLLPVLLLFNDGAGHFSEARELGPVAQARSIAAADLDGDGDLDLVLVQRGEANRYFLNDGHGRFGVDIELPGAWQTIQVAIGDVDGDDRADLIFSNRGGEGVVLYRGLTEGGFAEPTLLGGELDMEIRAIELGDVTGDDHPDIIAGGMGAESLIFVNDGDGGFAQIERFGAEADIVFGLALADFNQDGMTDIAVANGGVRNRVYLRDGDGFVALEVGDEASDSYNLSVGDLNADGRPDIVYAVSEGSNYTLINRIDPD
ncbi:VCBS repeat-containing protein [Maricaulis sp.]|jgi:VCBS repeat protein|uniref:FG-GAP repeat domain-containing protein n=1 Tax=Maricaulis sp. TaxID=1486257 RepID=UPI002600EA7F|nr:VCBS repeat-containing protein [Maricaulis sp.]MDF1767820.1 VCBS repeat-containing protein [Maricaulis sp.]